MAPTAVSSAASSRRPLSAPVWVCSLRDATEAWEMGVGQRERNLHELCGCEAETGGIATLGAREPRC